MNKQYSSTSASKSPKEACGYLLGNRNYIPESKHLITNTIQKS